MIPNTEVSSKQNFDSKCDQTMIGFVQNLKTESSLDNLEITCFWAEREKSDD